MTEPAIAIKQLEFGYSPNALVLQIDDLQIERGEHVFLFGPSGSGKTTLLAILAGILKPGQGEVRILGQNFTAMSSHERDHYRGVHMGYIFQMFNLIPYLDVRANISLPCRMVKERRARVDGSIEEVAKQMATELGLGDHLTKPVTELSVGQQQRVAAARALMGAPELIIADEPTSALDFDRREAFIKMLFAQAAKTKSTVLFVSHDQTLANLFHRQIALSDVNRAEASES